jgi:hypothetical protein
MGNRNWGIETGKVVGPGDLSDCLRSQCAAGRIGSDERHVFQRCLCDQRAIEGIAMWVANTVGSEDVCQGDGQCAEAGYFDQRGQRRQDPLRAK